MLAALALLGGPAEAQPDPFRTRVRGLTETPYSSYQGAECVSVETPPDTLWDILVSSEHVRAWLLTDLPNVVARGASYRKGREATKGDVLVIDVDTLDGPRKVEVTVIVFVPGKLLAFEVTKDDGVIARSAAHLIHTFFLDEQTPGRTDLWWALHFDADSPLSAVFSTIGKREYHRRARAGLQVLKGLAEVTQELNTAPK